MITNGRNGNGTSNGSDRERDDLRESILEITRRICQVEYQKSELDEELDRLISELDEKLHGRTKRSAKAAKGARRVEQIKSQAQRVLLPAIKDGSVSSRVLAALRGNGGKLETRKIIDALNTEKEPTKPKHIRGSLNWLKKKGFIRSPQRGAWALMEVTTGK